MLQPKQYEIGHKSPQVKKIKTPLEFWLYGFSSLGVASLVTEPPGANSTPLETSLKI